MTWFSLPGTLTPQSKLVRETDKSFNPPSTNLTVSFLRLSGRIKPGFAA